MNSRRIRNILLREFPIYYISRIFNLLPNNVVTCKVRGFFVGKLFGKCGKKFSIAQGSIINYPENIEVGENTYFAHRIYINAQGGFIVGSNIMIGPNCVIATTNHRVKNNAVQNDGVTEPIYIGDGSWIGAGVTITAGVRIGRSCLVAAGAVVTKNVSDNTMVAGVPAIKIKEL